MKLKEEPFENIKAGKKQIEFRLYDEKRKKLQLGDTIEFRKLPDLQETLTVEITGLLHYNSFAELFSDLREDLISYSNKSKEELVKSMHRYYTEEEEREKGVLGIRIKLRNREDIHE